MFYAVRPWRVYVLLITHVLPRRCVHISHRCICMSDAPFKCTQLPFSWCGVRIAFETTFLFFFKCRAISWVWHFLPKASASLADCQCVEIEGSFKNLTVFSTTLKKSKYGRTIPSTCDRSALAPTLANSLRHEAVSSPSLCWVLTTLLTTPTGERTPLSEITGSSSLEITEKVHPCDFWDVMEYCIHPNKTPERLKASTSKQPTKPLK